MTGEAGASARREYERRTARRDTRIRTAHPRLGGLILALSDEPQNIKSWDRGAVGERILAARLNDLSQSGVLLLHDRGIPRSRANIDHIAVSAAGVFVIDAKRYRGRPELRVRGGVLRPRTETLMVGHRDSTKLVDGIASQVERVRTALGAGGFADVPIRGVLCFVEADWPLFGGTFTIAGIDVVHPRKLIALISASGCVPAHNMIKIHQHLAGSFPPA